MKYTQHSIIIQVTQTEFISFTCLKVKFPMVQLGYLWVHLAMLNNMFTESFFFSCFGWKAILVQLMRTKARLYEHDLYLLKSGR